LPPAIFPIWYDNSPLYQSAYVTNVSCRPV